MRDRHGQRPRRRRGEAGLTLLELLIVISILSLLTVVASVQVSGYLGRAKEDTVRLQMTELGVALDLFRLDVGRFPTTDEGLAALIERPASAPGWRGPYLKTAEALRDPWDRAFDYAATDRGKGYSLGSLGADGLPGGEGEDADVGV